MKKAKLMYHIAPSEAMTNFAPDGDTTLSPDHNSDLLQPNPVENLEPIDFIHAIFGNISPDAEEQPLLCGFPDDPNNNKYWNPVTCQDGKLPTVIQPSKNCYFNMATFKPDPSGTYRARKQLVVANYAILLDDLGTKASTDEKLPLSWLTETSPGNYQGGLLLDEPCKDIVKYQSIVNALGKQKCSDKGASGGVRWGRFPLGLNTKDKYYERYIVQEIPDFVIELNVDHFVAREGSKTVVCLEYYDPVLKRIILVRMSFADFKNYFSNKQVWGIDKKGNPVLIPLGLAWISSKYRRQYKGIRMTQCLTMTSISTCGRGLPYNRLMVPGS